MSTKKKLFLSAAGAAGGATTDVDDVFATNLWKGNAALNIIDNGIKFSNTHDGGSARFDSTTSRLDIASSTDFNLGTGDFTIDFSAWWADGSQYQTVFSRGYSAGMLYQLNTDGTSTLYVGGGGFITDSTARAAGNWYQYCITRESGTVKLYVNGTLATTTTGNDNITSSDALNIGDDDSTSGYGINGGKQGFISNFRIVKGSAVTPPSGGYTSDLTAVSGTVLLTCQGDTPFVDNSSSSHSITKVNTVIASEFGPFTGNEGEGGLLWTKQRTSGSNEHHWLLDTARTAQYTLSSNLNSAQINQTSYAATFNSAGFQIYNWGYQNDNNEDYVGWSFRKAPKFFDVVTYTGNGVNGRSVSHDLGATPGMIILKRTNSTDDWQIFHRYATNKRFILNGTGNGAATTLWGSGPTSTAFTVETASFSNENGAPYIAYLFAHNNNDGDFGPDGDQDIIKCGSYVGNNSTNGPIINLGFEPQWLFIRHADANGNSSFILDNMRGLSTGHADPTLSPNANNDEQNTQNMVDLTSTGFQLKRANDNINGNGNNYIYMAIRRGPLAAPDDATKVFALDQLGQTSPSPPAFTSGFAVDTMLFRGAINNNGQNPRIFDRLRGPKELNTNNTNTESTNNFSYYDFDYSNGVGSNTGTATDNIMYMWKRAPGYFDVVTYSGTGSARTQSHNLGAVPEMIWIKGRSQAENWAIYHKDVGATKYLQLNSTNAEATSSTRFNDTAPTSSVFSLGADNEVNMSGQTFVAWLFATVAGVSKVGSYTGNDTGQNIDCGFSSGARFVLIKCSSDGDRSWMLFDSIRGIVAGTDPFLAINENSPQYYAHNGAGSEQNYSSSNLDLIDPYSSGFAVVGGTGMVNENGKSYIFYAIA